jgi:hypothetical protein
MGAASKTISVRDFSSLRVGKELRRPDTVYIFQNREDQIKLFAQTCLANLQNSRRTASDQSTHKMVLLTAAQIWGSGKSWLGNYWLRELKKEKYQELRSELIKEFGQEDVTTIMNSIYILVDLRDHPVEEEAAHHSFKLAILDCLLMEFPEEREFWAAKPISYALDKIVGAFASKYSKHFFIHIDEFDEILSCPPSLSEKTLSYEAITRFYRLWKLMDRITRTTGITFYCSGRTSLLYALGKGKYPTIRSPGQAVCVLLDVLHENHIRQYLLDSFTFDAGK